jgi:hypothetical protein
MTTSQQANPTLLHRFLGIGMTLLSVVFVGMTVAGVAPLLKESEGDSDPIGYLISGIALIIIVVARVFLKPRVPPRRPGQSDQDYWTNRDSGGRILLIWFLMEGAGVLASIAFLLTGLPAAAIVMAGAIAIYWLTGPNAFGAA